MEQAKTSTSGGNVLFLILIAVALFAALSYAVSQSTRSGVDTTSKEKNQLLVSRILQYMTSVEQAVTRVRIANGCRDTQLNFANSVVSGYTNPSAPANGSCDIFSPSGGGVIYQKPPAELGSAYDYLINGDSWYKWIGTGDYPPMPSTSSGSDLTMALPITSQSLCLAFNAALGLPVALAVDEVRTTKFTGTYGILNFAPDNGGNVAGFYGARAACVQSDSAWYPYSAGANYLIYFIILAR